MFLKGLIMALISAAALQNNSEPKDIKEIMKRPLITGASVSADWLSPSPGKRLALRYTTLENIKVRAVGGRRGIDTVASLKEADLSDRTAIIAVDAFFWDSTLADSAKSLQALRKLVERADRLKIPLVLGEIPPLLPSRQPSYRQLNAEIHRLCKSANTCFVMPFDSLVRQIARDQYLDIKGKRYHLLDLIPDGLHINDVAGDYLADVLQSLLLAR